MKKRLFLLFPIMVLTFSCNQNNVSTNQSTLIRTFDVLANYSSLKIYNADGSILEQWEKINPPGAVNHDLNRYSEFKLDLYSNYYQILGTYTYNNVVNNVDIVFSISIGFKLS